MNFACFPISRASWRGSLLVLIGIAAVGVRGRAEERRNNPVSKIYVSDVSGDAEIDTGLNIRDLAKRTAYKVEGTVIETKKADSEKDKGKVYSTMVYSNGTGAYFGQDTRVEVKRFVQEPFTPNRTDMDVEPSISQTQAFVAHGTVALCNSKLVAGSRMNYATQFGQVNIRGQKVVIESEDDLTKISMFDGESTVRSSGSELGGQILHAGEQAIIRRPHGTGAPPQIQIVRIPPQEMADLDDKVSMACMAKKTVYFEVKERQVNNGGPAAGSGDAAPSSGDDAGGSAVASGPITAFDSNNAAGSTRTVSEIVAVPVVPTELPVKFTVSPAKIVGGGNGGG